MRNFLTDAQQALGFLVAQTSHIEAEVVRISYPDIQYPTLIPVDTSANEWAKSVTFFSMEQVGRAAWFNHMATDMPLADAQRTKYEQGIEMAGIGYRYTLEELGQSMMIPGSNLSTEKAEAARRSYEEFVEDVALRGDTAKGWEGLINHSSVTAVTAAATGTGSTTEWANKTADNILADVNDALSGIHSATLTIELANTLLLPVQEYNRIAALRVGDTQMTVLQFIRENNVFTAQTGQPLTIRAVRGLETAGGSNDGRMVAYRRDPQVLKLHIPMPHRFLPVWQTGPITFDVPGIFRLAGVDVRRPGAMRYVDGIM